MAVTNLGDEAVTRTDTSDPYNMAITVPANCRGIAVGLSHGTSSTDHVVSVVFDGVTFTRVIRATDTTTEPGDAILYFGAKLGGTFTSGAGTLVIQLATGTTDDIHINVWYAGSDTSADLAVIDSDSISDNAANPTVTLTKSGRSGLCVCQMYGGGAAPGGTLATGNTLDGNVDHTAFYSQSCHETTIDTADHTIGWSTLTSDDLAFVALCVVEKVSSVIDAQPASFAVAGTAASVPAGRVVSADAGAYSEAGFAVGTLTTRVIDAQPAGYGVSGATAGAVAGRAVDAGVGAYAVSGSDAAVPAGRAVDAELGAYALSGADVAPLAERLLDAAFGTYTLSGAEVELARGFFLALAAGSYALTGSEASMLATRLVSAEIGAFVVTGDSASLSPAFVMDATAAAYALAGHDADLIATIAGTPSASSSAGSKENSEWI